MSKVILILSFFLLAGCAHRDEGDDYWRGVHDGVRQVLSQ
jgi:hypothetical protein